MPRPGHRHGGVRVQSLQGDLPPKTGDINQPVGYQRTTPDMERASGSLSQARTDAFTARVNYPGYLPSPLPDRGYKMARKIKWGAK
jgi:hypothetical protein